MYYYGKILGYYYPDRDVTTDYLGKIIARGDVASALLFSESLMTISIPKGMLMMDDEAFLGCSEQIGRGLV